MLKSAASPSQPAADGNKALWCYVTADNSEHPHPKVRHASYPSDSSPAQISEHSCCMKLLMKSRRIPCKGSSYQVMTMLILIENKTHVGIAELTLQNVSNDFNGAAPHVQNLMNSLTNLIRDRKQKKVIFNYRKPCTTPLFATFFEVQPETLSTTKPNSALLAHSPRAPT